MKPLSTMEAVNTETGIAHILRINCEPPTATHQQKKVRCAGRFPKFYEPPKLKAARELFTAALKPHAFPSPIEGPVRITVVWKYSRPKSRKGQFWKITKPDTDNAVKLIKDVLTDCGYWIDDAQVCDEHLMKIYSDTPGISIKIEEIK